MKAPFVLSTIILALLVSPSGGCTDDPTPQVSSVEDAPSPSVDLDPWPPNMPDTLSLPRISIPDLIASAPKTGRFNIRGYVIDQKDGCYCPPGALCGACTPFSSWVTLATSPSLQPVPSPYDFHPAQITLDGPVGLPYDPDTEYAFSVEVDYARGQGRFVGMRRQKRDAEDRLSEVPDISLFFVSTLGITPVTKARL